MHDPVVRSSTFDVAIVGLGPVGSVLAILLGQHGHSVVVLERHAQPYPLPRAVHFDHEIARILQACGLGDQLPGIIEPQHDYEWRNAAGDTLLSFTNDGMSASGWPASCMFSQPQLEALLEQRVEEIPSVVIRRGVDVTGLHDSGDRVTLTTTDGDVAARYVVGCDGANSTVRSLIGATVTDLGFFYDWLIVDVIFDEPRAFVPDNLQICDPARPTTVVGGGPGRRRWEFMRLPDESLDHLSAEATAWALLAPFDATPNNCKIERNAMYRFQARWVDQWRVGNVLLAGDAAHQMPPFAGQGMCSGIRDAANVAWKLHMVLDGTAPDRILDAYELERAPNVRAYIEFSMALGEVICVPDPEAAAGRDAMMIGAGAAQSAPPPSPKGINAGVIHEADPHAGYLSVQGRVDGTLIDDLYGVGWRLICNGPVRLADQVAGWFSAIGGVVVEIDPRGDSDGTYATWFGVLGSDAVLQRPDFYVFGAGTDGNALVSELASQLSAN